MEPQHGDRTVEVLVVSVVLLFFPTLVVALWFASKLVGSNKKRSCWSETGFRDQSILVSLVCLLSSVLVDC